MKKILIITTLVLPMIASGACAQSAGNGNRRTGDFVYQVAINSLDSNAVKITNNRLQSIDNRKKRSLGTAILSSLGSSFVQKTINASSNIISLGLSYITDAIKKPSENFSNWHQALANQCTYTSMIQSENQIDDFYYLPSTNGALDPRNMKFNGFTCRNYIQIGNSGRTVRQKHAIAQDGQDKPREVSLTEGKTSPTGHDAFFLSCKLRTDSLGLSHLANHSKFMLAVDSFVFYPNYCNLRNDSTDKSGIHRFYHKRKNLKFQMKVKIFSSWVNEAIIFTSDQQLGEFTINADIDKNALILQGKDSVFIFNGKNMLDENTPLKTQNLVSISGESFIVPRSYYGTSNDPVWGTGQYRLELEVTETCEPNEEYYIDKEKIGKKRWEKVSIPQVGNGEAVNYANLMGNRKYLKDVWKEEWRTIKERRKVDSFWKNAWKQIKVAYVGDNWVQELVSPVATVLLQEETTLLQKLFDLNSLPSANAAAGGSSSMGGVSGQGRNGKGGGALATPSSGAAQQGNNATAPPKGNP